MYVYIYIYTYDPSFLNRICVPLGSGAMSVHTVNISFCIISEANKGT